MLIKIILLIITGPFSDDNYKDVAINIPMSKVCTEIDGVANLPFEVSGDFIKIWWNFNGQLDYVNDKYNFHSDKLVIYNVTTSDVGSYRCSVSGRNGDTEFAQVDLDNNCESNCVYQFIVTTYMCICICIHHNPFKTCSIEILILVLYWVVSLYSNCLCVNLSIVTHSIVVFIERWSLYTGEYTWFLVILGHVQVIFIERWS